MPHNGCPHQCVFCNQKNITGHSYQPTKDDVVSAIETAINSGVDNRGSSVQFNYNVYIKEEYTTKLDVKPVFTISKY